jgi:hypothetical protein
MRTEKVYAVRLSLTGSRPMNNCLIASLLVILILNQLPLIAHQQTRDWYVYSSSEDQFTVAVPHSVRIFKTSENKNEANLEPAQKENITSYVSIYEDTADPNEESKFRILVIHTRAKIFDSLSRNDLLTYLSVMMIGDDDDPQPSRELVVKVNGLNGKEYVWAKEQKVFENGSTGEIFKRGRIFDRGDKIYVVVFVGQDSDDLKSHVAKRFLNSFRLSPPKP